MHVVVVCPHCKGAMGVREQQRSATCPRCGRSLDPRRARAYHRTEDMGELARVVGEMNARLEGGFRQYEADVRAAGAARGGPDLPEDLATVAARVGLVRGMRAQLDKAVSLLCAREAGEFTAGELESVLIPAGWRDHQVQDALRGLLEAGEVIERRADSFALP